MLKSFRIAPTDIRDLGLPTWGCMATDRIVADGAPIGYAQRDREQVAPEDSGWRFFAGDEDDAYMDDVAHHGVYALNTIANYDPVIVPVLDAPPGSSFIREGDRLVPDPLGYVEDRD